jgi:hypothetical protein
MGDNVPLAALINPVGWRISQLVQEVHAAAGIQQANAENAVTLHMNCAVCWQPHNNIGRVPLVLTCGHIVCLACVSGQAQMQCPFCHQDIEAVVRLRV